MEYTTLGPTQLKVSRIGLGTHKLDQVGDPMGLLDRAVELGINFIDTANSYGDAEKILGRWSGLDSVVLAAKVGLGVGYRAREANRSGLSAYHIKRACLDSLTRLDRKIDLYQLHRPEPGMYWPEIWQAMAQLISTSDITYVGTSNFTPSQIHKSRLEANHLRMMGVVSEQNHFSEFHNWTDPSSYHEENVGFIAYKALERGRLAPNGVRWALDNGADVVLVGASSVEQLEEVVRATWAER